MTVAERSVCCRRKVVRFFGDIRIDNVGMSNDKKCLKSFSLKTQSFLRKVRPRRVKRSLKKNRKVSLMGYR